METSKRHRNDDEVVEESVDSPEAKRIRADFLFDILDDEPRPEKDDGSGLDPAIDDLYTVMRSFEKEIATVLPSDLASVPGPDPNPNQPDLGFLLEASDDELGLPPPEKAVSTGDVASDDDVGFGKIWGLDDDYHLEFGFGTEERDNGSDVGPVIFDGGLFDCAIPEFSDLTWRTEFLPAV